MHDYDSDDEGMNDEDEDDDDGGGDGHGYEDRGGQHEATGSQKEVEEMYVSLSSITLLPALLGPLRSRLVPSAYPSSAEWRRRQRSPEQSRA
jgi:hypothetical protein